jgi:negative regulator of flagellin synthesis FlgM
MRISGAQVQSVLEVHLNKVYGPQSKPRASASSGTDSLVLSDKAREMQQAREALSATQPVRSDLVAELKARIDSGSYSTSSDELASAILDSARDTKTIF